MRVKGYSPDHIGAQRGENESHVHDVEKGEKQESIRQKAAPDYELSMSADVQQRVRSSTGRLRLPDPQQLFRASSGQPMPLKSRNEDTYNRTEKK